jgi:hypothetical protein
MAKKQTAAVDGFDIKAWEKERKAAEASVPKMVRGYSLITAAAQYAPSLVPIAATLAPFEDLLDRVGAGPQKGSKHDSPKTKPYLDFYIMDPRYPGGDTDGCSIACKVTEDKVVISWYCMNGYDGKNYRDDTMMTLQGLWEYLRQLPRPYHSF